MAKILLAADNKSFDRENINELLNFMLEFTNLGLALQGRIVRKADVLLTQWQNEAKGDKQRPPKEFLTPDHLKKLREFMVQEKIDGMLENLKTFTPNEKKTLRTHISTYPAAWNRLEFWTH